MIEREYRARNSPSYKEDIRVETTVDAPCPPPSRHSHSHSRPVYQEEVRVSESTLDTPHHHHHSHHSAPSYHKETTVVEETTEVPHAPKSTTPSKFNMGYYADAKGWAVLKRLSPDHPC